MYANRDWIDVWVTVEGIAIHWAKAGRTEEAGVLLGYLERHDIRHAVFLEQREHALAIVRSRPDAQTWTAHGAALDRDHLVAYALRRPVNADDSP